jgi:hypothetical protein
MNRYFNLNRIKLLAIREIAVNKKNIPIMLISLILLFLLLDFSLLSDFFNKAYNLKHYQLYPLVALIYCLVITSSSFSELNSGAKETDYLMLPASVEEKFLVKLLYTTGAFILLNLAALLISGVIVETVRFIVGGEIIFKRTLASYTPKIIIRFLKYYIAMHSVFFMGSVFFKKLEFGKVVLAGALVIAAVGLYLLILNYIPVFKNTLTRQMILAQFGVVESQFSADSMRNYLIFFRSLTRDIKFAGFYILPFVFWGAAYIRLREEEASNGI